ncbi:MAG: DUF4845 domain-containing protein [Gammaproteobacteria bacterium]
MRQNILNRKNQKGMTLVSWVLLMALIGFLVLIVLRMFPIYSNYYKIQGVFHSLEEEKELYNLNRQQILTVMDRKLHINMVNDFKHDYFTINLKDNGNKEMTIEYQDRRNIMANIDVVVSFKDSIVVTRSGGVIAL